MVCKQESELGEVLTAATPRFEQRFDADLKEDRILQVQHGGSQKLGFTGGGKLYMAPFTSISQNGNIPLFYKKKKICTFHTCSSSSLTGR